MVVCLLTLLALTMPVSSIAVLCLEMVWYHVNIAPSHDTAQLLPQYAQYAQYDSDPLRDRTGLVEVKWRILPVLKEMVWSFCK